MYNKQQALIGIAIVLFGTALLLGNIFDVDVGALCCPVVLIAGGVLLLMRPQLLNPDTPSRLRLIGDVRRYGEWQVAEEELWIGIGDARLDMTDAHIPEGETRIRVYSFVGGLRVSVPGDVGISVASTSFITDARVLGHKRDQVLTPFEMSSDGYETAERKVRLEVLAFVGNLRVRQGQVEEMDADLPEQPESPDETPME